MDYPRTYGMQEHLKQYGNGANLLRTERLAQPRALRVGDTLATGEMVLAPPREGGNGSIIITLEGGFAGCDIEVPARIPIALKY